MPHHIHSNTDTYVVKYGYVPFNDSFHGKIIILWSFLEKVQNLFYCREREIYARPIMLKGGEGEKKGPLTIFTSEEAIYLLFDIFLTINYWAIIWNLGKWCIHRFFFSFSFFNWTSHFVSNSWNLEEGYKSDVTFTVRLYQIAK